MRARTLLKLRNSNAFTREPTFGWLHSNSKSFCVLGDQSQCSLALSLSKVLFTFTTNGSMVYSPSDNVYGNFWFVDPKFRQTFQSWNIKDFFYKHLNFFQPDVDDDKSWIELTTRKTSVTEPYLLKPKEIV